uniref:Uncharacterized protein n=1 Tax=Rhizobium rhizogenes TaxID=359 RepID=A0A7S5DS11_RHIRH|nr:hypothetical protein pC5.8b_465 [Rhizobium rhizogenes]
MGAWCGIFGRKAPEAEVEAIATAPFPSHIVDAVYGELCRS